jgi:hypothetical protein
MEEKWCIVKFALFYLLKKNSNNESNENSNWEIKVNILCNEKKKDWNWIKFLKRKFY